MSIINELIKNKCHLAWLKTLTNPKTQDYWLWVKNNMTILDLNIMEEKLIKIKEKIEKAKKDKRKILVLSNKLLIRDEIVDVCKKNWFYYLNFKVPAWVVTNFETLKKRIVWMNDLKNFINSEDFETIKKKEKLIRIRKLKKIENIYKWVENLKDCPDFVIIIDWNQMKNFVNEVEKMKIENVVISWSDFNRWWPEDSLIVWNISYYDSLMYIINYLFN